jgi:hypothetical protein
MSDYYEPHHHYLARLACDRRLRTDLVGVLVVTAGILEGHPFYAGSLEAIGPKLAESLRLVAAELCEHGRENSDGSCRYCDAAGVPS